MGTSLSGLTPATTFDGLLKTSDNDAITSSLKTIGSGDGTDSCLQLSDSALQVNGDLNVGSVHQIKQNSNNLDIIGNSNSTYLKYITNNGNNSTNIFGVGNFFRYNVVIGEPVLPSTASEMLRVKGSGSTSATTALLVQNSSGTDMFKVVDDNTMFYHTHKFRSAGGYLYIEGEGNVDRSLKVGQNFTASSYDGHIFKTYDGAAYSEAMRITGANDQFVGIGEDTPTARLHIKGSGATSATTSLLVQNSSGADVLQTLDNGSVGVGNPANSSYRVTMTSGVLRLKDLLFGQAGSSSINNTSLLTMKWNGAVGIGISGGGEINATARLHIKGAGNDNTTTSLLVQNSDGDDLFSVRDDGKINADNDFYVQGAIYGGSNTKLRVGTDLNIASTRAWIQGLGATSATTSLLVQNSDGDDMLKVTDDGITTFGQNDQSGSTPTGIEFQPNPLNATWGPSIKSYYNNNKWLQIRKGASYYTFADGGLGINMDATPSAQLHVKGSGATSATTALLVENSAGTDLLKVDDAGTAVFSGNTLANRLYSSLGFYHTGNTNNVLIPNSTTGWVLQTANATGNIQVKNINVTASKETTAALQVDSTTQGFLPPRMTGTQRDAIESPASGLIIYNTTTNKAQCYNGTDWNDMF